MRYRVATESSGEVVPVLRRAAAAGEDVPDHLYPRASLVHGTDAAGVPGVRVGLAGLVADITRVLAWFNAEPAED